MEDLYTLGIIILFNFYLVLILWHIGFALFFIMKVTADL